MTPAALARLLPAVYQQAMLDDAGDDGGAGSVLAALLGLISQMHGSTEAFLADPRRFIDPYRARTDFLTQLARWMALEPYLDQSSSVHSDVAALRELTRRAASLARRRGTADAMIEICELITGVKGFSIDQGPAGDDGHPLPYHFRLVVPAAASAKRAIVEKIVATEKPCFVTAEIVFDATVTAGTSLEDAASPEAALPTAEE